MATIIEVQDSKIQHLSDYAEKVLHYGGKLMQCLEGLEESSKYHEYRGVPSRYEEKERWDEGKYRGRYY